MKDKSPLSQQDPSQSITCKNAAGPEASGAEPGEQRRKQGKNPIPPPPFPPERMLWLRTLSLTDVAGFLRITVCALKKRLDGRPGGSPDPLGKRLRSMLVPGSNPRRIQAQEFHRWYTAPEKLAS